MGQSNAGERWAAWAAIAIMTACGGGDDRAPAVPDDGGADSGVDDGVDDGPDDSGGNTEEGDDSTGGGDPDARPNWHEDIAPLVAANCSACHTTDGLAFPMQDYAAVAPWAPSMAYQTAERLMPPWHAVETDECEPFAAFERDARLDAADIELIQAWADLDAPEGDPAKAAPIPASPSLDLEDPDLLLDMGGAITIEVEPDVLDQFHCLTFDPGLTEDVYLDGLQVLAGNTKIVHHVVVFVDEAAASASWPDGILHDCGGGSGVPGARMVAAWVPGNLPTEPPADVGIKVPAGSRMIYNVHYHANVLGPETDDTTALALRYTTNVPAWVSEFRLLGAPGDGTSVTGEFLIPADAVGHEETIEWPTPPLGDVEVRLWAVGNHMHKIAVDAKVSVLRGDDEQCLVQTPRWDFGWQRLYEYDLPIEEALRVESGDVFRIRCTYDNSLANPGVVSALAEVGLDAPLDVELGEATLDEMCLAGVGVAIRQ